MQTRSSGSVGLRLNFRFLDQLNVPMDFCIIFHVFYFFFFAVKDADEELRKRGLEVPDDADAGLPLDSSSDEFEEGQGFDSRKRRKIGRPNIDVY